MIGKHTKNSGRQVGVMSQDMIHKLDTMTDEVEAQNSPYVAKKKTNVNNKQMFDDNLYSDSSDEDNESSNIIAPILVVIAIVAIIIGVVIFI